MPSGDQLISCSRDKTIRVWETATGYCVKTLTGHAEWVRDVAVSPCGALIASCSQDQSVRLWNWESGACTQILDGHEHVVESVAFSNASADATIVACAAAAAKAAGVPPLPGTADAESADGLGGGYVVSASRDKTVRVWSVATGECVSTLRGHDNWVLRALFHPGGQFIVSASEDRSLRVWDMTQSGRCRTTLENAHGHFVSSLAIHRGGALFASGGVDKLVKVWRGRKLRT